ncbi:hypothetical protein SARC_01124 [Sphaeroforma arctica JP610]|uniref:Glucose-methanol-choline oxidoreductase N-terminal domain-containing protein n=1 Tax=Sphaeroforma arctica JP610 TaxID=667725 RepID=A0A0L0GCK4_9EUKA|nr:hypothetical protein SARC_01124 [Sphaeroforma arctica JP610]KNC86745.1 hypothetical protein SARC_01124 [Sphaeroforma arctica JP610]|eukprot:XP_014160647.1 hypothetical protein SARC_01124 [Sphaeroforma arctica JP610]
MSVSKSLRSLPESTKQVYDYVVVGGGSAGCVMANRLSSNPNVRVALLEIGSDDNTPLIRNPSGFFWTVPYSRKYNHRYFTTPQKHCKGRNMFQPRGRGIGGSSAINAMVYIRGLKYDFTNLWAGEGKCQGWEWENVLPIFKQLECNDSLKNDPYHGTDGPVKVRTQGHIGPYSERIVKAGNELGWKTTKDFNGEDQSGVGYYQYTQSKGGRCSTGVAFLTPEVRSRPNLDVIVDAHTTKVLTEGKRATGVHAVVSGSSDATKPVTFEAKNDVILCGGAFNSPQLLMLSGIGPKDQLNKHGIEVVHELPGVGQNLQDHADICVNAKTSRISMPLQIGLTNVPSQIKHFFLAIFKKEGVFMGDNQMVGSFFKSKPDIPANDIQMHVAPFYYKDHGATLRYGGGISIKSCYMRPESRGTVALNSANPMEGPLIDPNYYDVPADFDPMVAAVRKSIELIQTNTLQEDNLVVSGFGDKDVNNLTDSDIKEYLRENTESIYHPVSTCRMGPSSDPMAVVDHSNGLRVHGMEGLRVIDASVMPTVVSGNTNAPTMVIAQKAYNQMIGQDRVVDIRCTTGSC